MACVSVIPKKSIRARMAVPIQFLVWHRLFFNFFYFFIFIFLKSWCHAQKKDEYIVQHTHPSFCMTPILEFFSISCHLKLVPYQKMDWRILPILLLVWQWLRPLGTFLCEAAHSVWDHEGWKKYHKFSNKGAMPLSLMGAPPPLLPHQHPRAH